MQQPKERRSILIRAARRFNLKLLRRRTLADRKNLRLPAQKGEEEPSKGKQEKHNAVVKGKKNEKTPLSPRVKPDSFNTQTVTNTAKTLFSPTFCAARQVLASAPPRPPTKKKPKKFLSSSCLPQKQDFFHKENRSEAESLWTGMR